METFWEMPDLEIKSLQTALKCHEDYTRKQIDAHRQSSVHTRKLDLRRDAGLRCKGRGGVEAEYRERQNQQLAAERGALDVQVLPLSYLGWRSSLLSLPCPFQLQNHYFHSPGHCHYHCHHWQSTHTFWVPCPK